MHRKEFIRMNGSVISFDVSKGSCHYQAFIDFKKPIFKPKKLMWTLDSFENLQKDIELLKEESDGNSIEFILEATGIYSKPLEKWLKDGGYTFYVISPLLDAKYRQTQLHGNKTDALDCAHIAQVYYSARLTPKQNEEEVYVKLRSLNRYYEDQLEHLRKYKVTLRAYLDSVMPGFDSNFPNKDIYKELSMEILKKYPHPIKIHRATRNSMIKYLLKKTSHHEAFIERYVDRIKEWSYQTYSGFEPEDEEVHIISKLVIKIEQTNKEADETLEKIIELAKTTPHFDQIHSICGIGENLAARIIAEIGDMKRFKGKNQIVSYAGLDPMIRQSGNVDGNHLSISKKGNKRLRCLLYLAVSCNLRLKKEDTIYNYYQKKRQQVTPLCAKAARIACAHKLLILIYGICKTDAYYNY